MNKRGQSILEIGIIAMLIVLGVVVMGPYVLRSINAHFKLWDEGVQDSFDENITQAPISDVPPINVTCTCSDTDTGQCGSSQAGAVCGAGQDIISHGCTPQDCDGEADTSCQNNFQNCCGSWVSEGCGTMPLPTDANGNVNTSPPTTPINGNCYYGQQIMGHPCGNDGTVQCVPNAQCTMPGCQGIVDLSKASPCPGNITTGIAAPTGITYVSNESLCTGAKCQYYYLNTTPPCMIHDFIFPDPRPGAGQQCGDTASAVHATDICAAYGFSGGKVCNSGTFQDGPYSNDFYITYPITASGGSGSFVYTLNGNTASWTLIGSCNNYANVCCDQASSGNPNPVSPPNSTVCPNNPMNANKYFTIPKDNTCDGKTVCQATCNPGYYRLSGWGPCVVNACKNPPKNSSLCSTNTIPPVNNTATKLTATCDGSYVCQASCDSGYSLNAKGTKCTSSS